MIRRRAVEADLHHAADAGGAHVLHNVHKVLCKTVLAQMGVRIKIHGLLLILLQPDQQHRDVCGRHARNA